MEILLANETEAAGYVIERLGEAGVHYWNKSLHVCTLEGKWLSNKKQIHQYLLKEFSPQMTMWLNRVNRFNAMYHMLTVMTYRTTLPNFIID